jgi:hypothetical protein
MRQSSQVSPPTSLTMSWAPTYTSTLRQLSIPSLYQEKVRFENSINHLHRSNKELKEHEVEADEDTTWVQSVVTENEQVIAKQSRQIELIELELSCRSVGSNSLGSASDRRQEASNGEQRMNGESGSEPEGQEDKMDVDTDSQGGLRL